MLLSFVAFVWCECICIRHWTIKMFFWIWPNPFGRNKHTRVQVQSVRRKIAISCDIRNWWWKKCKIQREKNGQSHWIMQIVNVIGVISNVNIKTYVIEPSRSSHTQKFIENQSKNYNRELSRKKPFFTFHFSNKMLAYK